MSNMDANGNHITEYLFMENTLRLTHLIFPIIVKCMISWIHKQVDFVFCWNSEVRRGGKGVDPV